MNVCSVARLMRIDYPTGDVYSQLSTTGVSNYTDGDGYFLG